MRDARWLALAPLLAGCGLVIDLAPPDPVARLDGGRADAGAPRDGGRADSGSRADASARDASSASDASAPDANVPDDARVPPTDAGPPGACRSSRECASGEYCERPRGVCYGPGTCTPTLRPCPEIIDPVCGCDWVVYVNECEAAVAGVNVMEDDACPAVGVGGEWCPYAPSGSDPGGCPRCFDDRDCGSALAPICVASSCRSMTMGVCAFAPPAGYCYDARQCRAGERCDGASIEVCPPAQGRCVATASP